MDQQWAQLTPEAKKEQRFQWWLNPQDIKFVSPEAEKGYKQRVQRMIDVYNVQEPDMVPVSLFLSNMPAHQYGVFMKDPSDFWLRRYLPRTFGILEPLKAWPHFMSVIGLTHTYTMTLARPDVQAMLQKLLDIGKELSEWTRATERIAMRGLSLGFPNWMGPMAIAPFDVIGDNLRGTTGIMMDIYRQPAKLLEALDEWAYRKGVKLNFIRPGKPIENALAESFNGRLRDECLNTNWFMNLKHAREVIEDWRRDYNEVRPHSSLKGSTPKEYAEITAGL